MSIYYKGSYMTINLIPDLSLDPDNQTSRKRELSKRHGREAILLFSILSYTIIKITQL